MATPHSDSIADSLLMSITLTLPELEAAINYWRSRSPSQGEELALCPQASALAVPYAMLIFDRKQAVEMDELSSAAQQALREWLSIKPRSGLP